MRELNLIELKTHGVLPASFRRYCVARDLFDTVTMFRILRAIPEGMTFEVYLVEQGYLTLKQAQVFYDELAGLETSDLTAIYSEDQPEVIEQSCDSEITIPTDAVSDSLEHLDVISAHLPTDARTAKEALDDILTDAVQTAVSDIHFSAGLSPTYRRHGDLVQTTIVDELTTETISRYAQAMCTDKQWTHFLELGEVDLAYEIAAVSRFRVNIYQQKGNTSIAIRSIPTQIPRLDSLKMPDLLKEMVQKKQGLFLVTGPTGSGKSTTLAAMIDYLNRYKKDHIITLEDPIEYVHHHNQSIIDQREVGRDTQSFSNGLRAALRQDPDVILVGEMRDFETISIALTAAETGHLVLGTLHTSSAAATIERIVDVFSPEQQPQIMTQLSGALVGILAQRLLPTPDFSGRVPVTELMVNNASIANLIRANKTHQITSMLQMGAEEGMYTMASSIKQVLANHAVDVDAAERLLEN